MPSYLRSEMMFDTRSGFDFDTELGAWSLRGPHWGGRGAVLRNNNIRNVDMLFMRCKEEYGCES